MAECTNSDQTSLLKNRVKNLFQFLFEANRLRFRPERELNEQVRVISLGNLPEHPDIQLIRPCAVNEQQEAAEFELHVKRAKTTRCPNPSDDIKDWLVSGWDDPNQTPVYIQSQNQVDQDGNTITILFNDDLDRVASWDEWINKRNDWVPPELLARRSLRFFETLYELHSYLENEGDRVELMIGDGLLTWKAYSTMEQKYIHLSHPVLLKRIELLFDPNKPAFQVVDTDRASELYTSFLIDIDGINATGLNQRQKELALSEYHPFGYEDTTAFMKSLVQTISPTHGEYFDQPESADESFPHLWRDPVIFVRKRVSGVANAISRILDDIDHRTVFPPAFGQIAGLTDKEWSGTGLGDAPDKGTADNKTAGNIKEQLDVCEILLAKETNEEQLQIIRCLSEASSVLVQGPPGTGKTHTIGNIIGHLLSQGKKILVTSHTPKALRVLRGQIPKDLRSLCVSVLGWITKHSLDS